MSNTGSAYYRRAEAGGRDADEGGGKGRAKQWLKKKDRKQVRQTCGNPRGREQQLMGHREGKVALVRTMGITMLYFL